MRDRDNKRIGIACTVLAETDLAYRINDGKFVTWIPKSQCGEFEPDGPGKKTGTIDVAEWLATKLGLV